MAKYNNQNRNQAQRGGQSKEPASERVSLKSFYKTTEGKKVIDPDLFDKTAKSYALSFSSKQEDKITGEVSITQLRRLFDEVKRFQQILETATEGEEEAVWEKQLPYIKMIRSKVHYTIARMKSQKMNRYYDNLAQFISGGIDLIKTREDYFVFSSLFEAVYGFYYEYAPKE